MTPPPITRKYAQRPEFIQRITDASTQEAVEILRLPKWPLLNKVIASLIKKEPGILELLLMSMISVSNEMA